MLESAETAPVAHFVPGGLAALVSGERTSEDDPPAPKAAAPSPSAQVPHTPGVLPSPQHRRLPARLGQTPKTRTKRPALGKSKWYPHYPHYYTGRNLKT